MAPGREGQDSVRVLYVGGAGRSGSTLVGRVLGSAPGAFHAGELMFIWRRGVIENQLCGCGEAFLDCAFWTEVGHAAFGGWQQSLAAETDAVRARLERNRRVPMLTSKWVPKSVQVDLASYVERTADLYRAVANVSGATVVVDTSKGPPHALVLRRAQPLELRVCLLVRDSRGVAHSWTRRKPRPEIQTGDVFMNTYSSGRSTIEWVSFNSAFELGPLFGVPTLRVRYEDFVAAPRVELDRITSFAGTGQVPPAVVHDGSLELSPDHSVAGNPMRFTSGPVELVVDDEWRTAMPTGRRRMVSALTVPWLLRYGYLQWPSGRAQPKSRSK